MKRASFAEMECPIARSLDEIGEAWTLLLLREAMLGTRQFGDFQERLGIQSSTLTRRLEELVVKGILERRAYSTSPPRSEYVPTEKGTALLPILLSLAEWGNQWIFGEGAEPILTVDARSGAAVFPQIVDRRRRTALTPGTVRLVAGPAASPTLRRALDVTPRVLGELPPREAVSPARRKR